MLAALDINKCLKRCLQDERVGFLVISDVSFAYRLVSEANVFYAVIQCGPARAVTTCLPMFR